MNDTTSAGNGNSTVTGTGSGTGRVTGNELLRQWTTVRDQLSRRSLISTLLPGGAVKYLSNYMEELVISCQKAGTDCDFSKEHIYWWFQPDFFKCFTFDIMKGKHMDEATSQGKYGSHRNKQDHNHLRFDLDFDLGVTCVFSIWGIKRIYRT